MMQHFATHNCVTAVPATVCLNGTVDQVECRNEAGDILMEVRVLEDERAVRTYVSDPERPRLNVTVDGGGVHIFNSADDVHSVIRHRAPSRLERLGAVLDSLSSNGTWTDPPAPLVNVQDVAHLELPDGSVVVRAQHEDGRVTTWSRGPDGWFQKRLRGLNRALFGRAS